MARTKGGILSPFRGAIGTVQGTKWKGRHVVASRNKNPNTPLTTPVLNQRSKFANCRYILSQAQTQWQYLAVGNGTKSLPQWQEWVKQMNGFYTTSNDFSVNPIVVTKTEDDTTVDLGAISYNVQDGNTYIYASLENSAPQAANAFAIGAYFGAPYNSFKAFVYESQYVDDFSFVVYGDLTNASYCILVMFWLDGVSQRAITTSCNQQIW